MQNPLRVAIKMPLARQRHSERSVGERIVNGEASSQRERGHLARLSACGDESAPRGRIALPIEKDAFRVLNRE
jgi:hypothetical protein